MNCREDGHTAWNPACKTREREVERMRKRLAMRPREYGGYRREEPQLRREPIPSQLKVDGRTKAGIAMKRQRMNDSISNRLDLEEEARAGQTAPNGPGRPSLSRVISRYEKNQRPFSFTSIQQHRALSNPDSGLGSSPSPSHE